MLEVQKFLNNKQLEDLTTELGIKVKPHDTLPLVILDYSQIDSPKTNPIVRECRGLVLNKNDYSVVAKGFNRFFNWGEVQDEMCHFDFTNFVTHTKEDGSLVLIYNFDDQWMANTRGSYGTHKMELFELTWQDAFCEALKIKNLQELDGKLDPSLCYVCEFCSPYNKIVRRYPEPKMYLLSIFKGIKELDYKTVDDLCGDFFLRPYRYHFNSIEGIQNFLRGQAQSDPTFEGVVIVDSGNRRWKIKSATYLGLHRLGNNQVKRADFIDMILVNETSEIETYFPEYIPIIDRLRNYMDEEFKKLMEIWNVSKNIENQKDFALSIVGKTKFTAVLFSAKKQNVEPGEIWQKSVSLIDKMIPD